ncbi:PHP domain-containing protein [Cetobacterium sp.]|uniref:PHP domain-containing protein n=1 Tax=Cetobacterium sp. TaxID=2071632 RepID=UPI003F2F6EF8
MKKKYDLHTHTTYSDGTFTVDELLKRAKYIGLTGISITDHDTMEGVSEAKNIAENLDLDFISGIEFSCSCDGYEIHILGYLLDEKSEKLASKLIELKKARNNRNEKIVKRLNSLGLKITLEEIEQEATGTIVSRAHICNVMMKKGFVYTKGEAFKQYLGRKGAAYIEKECSNPFEIIKLIKECGGVSALAHPSLICDSKEKIEKILNLLIEAGLDGLEVEYSSYTPKDREYYRELAKSKNLLMVGGSDFHGGNRAGIDIAHSSIAAEDIKDLLERRYKED